MAMGQWTREWWDGWRSDCEIVTSAAVLLEIESGDHPLAVERLAMLKGVPMLDIDEEVVEIAEDYIERMLMPRGRAGDALHLALASWHRCDILLTWNCRHLANFNKKQAIRRINESMGLYVPELLTPMELLSDENGAENGRD